MKTFKPGLTTYRLGAGGLPVFERQHAGRVERTRGRALMTLRSKVWRRDCGVCHCPACVASGRMVHLRADAWQMDHLVALASGGTDAMDNLAAVSPACHAAKTADEARLRALGLPAPGYVWRRHPALAGLGLDELDVGC